MRSIRYFFIFIFFTSVYSCGVSKKSTRTKSHSRISKSNVLERYSEIIGKKVHDEKLYNFVDEWLGVPYKFGGKSKGGVDCSNFTCELLKNVYNFPSSYYFPSSKLAEQGKTIPVDEAKEGDLVFFVINNKSKVSHVGVYLSNNKFVHASTSKGVVINSIEEGYYIKRFSYIRRLR